MSKLSGKKICGSLHVQDGRQGITVVKAGLQDPETGQELMKGLAVMKVITKSQRDVVVGYSSESRIKKLWLISVGLKVLQLAL